jgi:Transposase, Mutator family
MADVRCVAVARRPPDLLFRGHQPRTVITAAGPVEVKAPRVNDRRVDEATGERQRFSSKILPPWCRKSPAKELTALAEGAGRESTESWADLLRDCRRRGMRDPELVVGDGAMGLWTTV